MTFEATKWVACDDPAQAAGAVVRAALAGRLGVVEHYLEPTSPDEAHDPEHVHQLRVATRRANAAVRAFGEFLPRGKAKKLRRLLREIRRAAGEARDQDVLAMRYSNRYEEDGAAAQDWLWSRIVDARRAAYPAVDDVYRRYAAGTFAEKAEKLVASLRWRGDGDEPTFATVASEGLARAADEFFRASRSRPKRAAQLHRLRIAAKRFRYAIELFAAAAPALRDDVYPAIEEIQERLGKANDHAVAAERIASWEERHAANGSALPKGVDRIVKREKKRAAAARRAFHEWWTADRAEAVESRYAEIIKAAIRTAENTGSP